MLVAELLSLIVLTHWLNNCGDTRCGDLNSRQRKEYRMPLLPLDQIKDGPLNLGHQPLKSDQPHWQSSVCLPQNMAFDLNVLQSCWQEHIFNFSLCRSLV